MRRFAFTFSLAVAACGTPPGTTDGGSDGSAGGSSGGATSQGSTGGSSGVASTGDGSGGQTGGTSSTGSTGAPESTGSSGGGESTGAPGSTGGSSGGGGLCDGFEEPGCIHKGCPMGQICDTKIDCVPSTCSCDPKTGDIACTADCGGGTCVMQGDCPPVPCDLFCEFGFEKDMNGCEICKCAAPPPDCGCLSDGDCVKASPGCCSCAMGGKEVAVAAACVDMLEKCPLPPDQVACPAVYLCTDAKAACVQGACVLQ